MKKICDLIKNGKFLSIEISPSFKKSLGTFSRNEKLIKITKKVNSIILTDSPLGKYTHNSIMSSIYFQKEFNINAIATFAMRDKNIPYSLSEIKSSQYLGMKNFLFLTGDKTTEGKNVFEKNSTDFIKDVYEMRKEYDLNTIIFSSCSNKLTKTTKKKIMKKIENGSDCIISQPCTSFQEALDLKSYIEFCNSKLNKNCNFVAGIFPVINLKTADFIINNVKGAEISYELYKYLKDGDLDKAFEYNYKLFKDLKKNNINIHLMTANNFDLMLKILNS